MTKSDRTFFALVGVGCVIVVLSILFPRCGAARPSTAQAKQFPDITVTVDSNVTWHDETQPDGSIIRSVN